MGGVLIYLAYKGRYKHRRVLCCICISAVPSLQFNALD